MALSNVKHEMPMDMQELYESGVKYFHFYGDAIARTHERKLARNPAFAPVPSPSREPAATNPALNSIRKPVLTPEQPPVLEPAPDPSREPCLNPIPRNSFEISA
ncbi:hypothetical protein PV326_000735 [Microctonus aethiopoides]|nr:hypothetical protein PV326_000735 [Microctonus aethiopoides]